MMTGDGRIPSLAELFGKGASTEGRIHDSKIPSLSELLALSSCDAGNAGEPNQWSMQSLSGLSSKIHDKTTKEDHDEYTSFKNLGSSPRNFSPLNNISTSPGNLKSLDHLSSSPGNLPSLNTLSSSPRNLPSLNNLSSSPGNLPSLNNISSSPRNFTSLNSLSSSPGNFISLSELSRESGKLPRPLNPLDPLSSEYRGNANLKESTRVRDQGEQPKAETIDQYPSQVQSSTPNIKEMNQRTIFSESSKEETANLPTLLNMLTVNESHSTGNNSSGTMTPVSSIGKLQSSSSIDTNSSSIFDQSHEKVETVKPSLRRGPSKFSKVICGETGKSSDGCTVQMNGQLKQSSDNLLPKEVFFTETAPGIQTMFNFSTPSPDDIVLSHQRKAFERDFKS